MRFFLFFCLCLSLILPTGARAAFFPKDAPVSLQQTWNPKTDARDIILPMPCGLSMAFRAVAVPGKAGQEFPFVMGISTVGKERRIYGERREGRIAGVFAVHDLPIAWRSLLPKLQVEEDHTFYFLGKYEVSQAQWNAVMNGSCPVSTPTAPSLLDRARGWVGLDGASESQTTTLPPDQALPARGLSWSQMQVFIEKYNAWLKQHADQSLPRFVDNPDNPKNQGFLRLPTEAEWEFAARGGLAVSDAERAADSPPLAGRPEEYAVFASQEPSPVGSRQPNPLGLHDMAGNVKEMTDDAFRVGGSTGGQVVKGGGFRSQPDAVLPGWRDEADRSGDAPNDQGFRLVLSGKLTASAQRVGALNTGAGKEEQEAQARLDKERAEVKRQQEEVERERAKLAQMKRRQQEEQARLDKERAEVKRQQQEVEQARLDKERAEVKRQQEEVERERAKLAQERAEMKRRQQEAQARLAEEERKQADSTVPTGKTWKNSIDMEFVLIPAGTFEMGCSSDAEECYDWEKPRHSVKISQSFYLGKYEVTQRQWEAVMGNNPSSFKGPDRPVVNVSWDEVQEFIKRLNAKEGHNRYRLPTEAEWEYAARAGSTTAYSFGNNKSQLGDYAWYEDNSGRETHPVGQKRPNAWGLYDMHGNVWEWVQDWYGGYSAGAVTDPKGPNTGENRVLRGGSWYDVARVCRSAIRGRSRPDNRYDIGGLRLALFPGH